MAYSGKIIKHYNNPRKAASFGKTAGSGSNSLHDSAPNPYHTKNSAGVEVCQP